MSDILDRVRAADPASHLAHRRLDEAHLRADLDALLRRAGEDRNGSTDTPTDIARGTDGPTVRPVTDLGRRRRLSRRTGIALGLAAVTAVGGTAAALTLRHDPPAEVSGIECLTPDGGSLPIGGTGADPVERCRQLVRDIAHQELAADAVAYRRPGGLVTVGPRSSMPSDATPLADARPDVRLAELHHALTDAYAGVGFEADGPCRPLADTRRRVEALLTRLGITGYPLQTETLDPGADDRCVYARLDTDGHRMVLERRLPAPAPTSSPTPPDATTRKGEEFIRLVGRRCAELTRQHASAAQMEAMVNRTAQEQGIAATSYSIDVVRSPVNAPTRLYYSQGGKNFFHIYGPETP